MEMNRNEKNKDLDWKPESLNKFVWAVKSSSKTQTGLRDVELVWGKGMA